MSRAHEELAELAAANRLETGKERLRFAQLVLTAYAEGLGLADTARRVGASKQTVWRVRVWLGLQSTEKRRHDSRTSIEELCP